MAKILVVDDDRSIVKVLTHILSREGYTVCAAYDGRQGLEVARQEKPDLIILDIMMPELDGVNVCRHLFADPALQRLPVLILTARESSRQLFLDLTNVVIHMIKPFDTPTLLKNIRQLFAAPPTQQ